MTQSQNGSIRASLVMPDVYQHYEDSQLKEGERWLELNDQYLCVNQIGFTHFANVFFSNALQKAVSAFTDTGVLQYLFECNYHIKRQFQPPENSPNVLNLSFGFYIWLGTCCISIISFLVEFFMWTCKKKQTGIQNREENRKAVKVRKIKYAKIYQALYNAKNGAVQNMKIKAETLKKFKILKKNNPLQNLSSENEKIIIYNPKSTCSLANTPLVSEIMT